MTLHPVAFALVLAATFAAAQPVPPKAAPARDADELLVRARASASSARVAEAERLGAELRKTSDGRSFALIWRPPVEPAGWIFTLHGSASWAYDEIALWQPFAHERRLGIVALQWWYGGGQTTEDYARPNDIRREFDILARSVGATPERTLLHGFSRGAANLYALVAFDAGLPKPLFRHVVANAGGMSPDYPPNRHIDSGGAPYSGTRWWLFCGSTDPNPERDGCPAMRRTRDWLAQRGAAAELREDPAGDHGGFHRRRQNVGAALDWFARSR